MFNRLMREIALICLYGLLAAALVLYCLGFVYIIREHGFWIALLVHAVICTAWVLLLFLGFEAVRAISGPPEPEGASPLQG